MPLANLHKKQKSKNLTLLAMLVFLVILFFAVTIIKFTL